MDKKIEVIFEVDLTLNDEFTPEPNLIKVLVLREILASLKDEETSLHEYMSEYIENFAEEGDIELYEAVEMVEPRRAEVSMVECTEIKDIDLEFDVVG